MQYLLTSYTFNEFWVYYGKIEPQEIVDTSNERLSGIMLRHFPFLFNVSVHDQVALRETFCILVFVHNISTAMCILIDESSLMPF